MGDNAVRAVPWWHTDDRIVQARYASPCQFFAERTRACLNGSSFGGSCLKMGWVGLGLHMEFHAGGQWIITSHVRAIAVEASPTGAPC